MNCPRYCTLLSYFVYLTECQSLCRCSLYCQCNQCNVAIRWFLVNTAFFSVNMNIIPSTITPSYVISKSSTAGCLAIHLPVCPSRLSLCLFVFLLFVSLSFLLSSTSHFLVTLMARTDRREWMQRERATHAVYRIDITHSCSPSNTTLPTILHSSIDITR